MKAIGVIIMAKKDIDAFNSRFDKVIEGLTEIKVETARISEHLKTLNGKVAGHEQRFIETYQEFKDIKNGKAICQENFRNALEKIKSDAAEKDDEQDKEMWGVKIKLIGLVSVITTIITTIVTVGLNFVFK